MKVKPEHVDDGMKITEGPFGVPDPMVAGLASSRPKIGMTHPLETSERCVSFIRTTFLPTTVTVSTVKNCSWFVK